MEMEKIYANVIVDISHEKVDRPFQYKVPEILQGKLKAGMCVRVPFGQGNKQMIAYVIELTSEIQYDPEKLKEIEAIENTGTQVESKLIELAWWMKEHYGSTMIVALKTVLPAKKIYKMSVRKTVLLQLEKAEAEQALLLYIKKKQLAKVRLLEELVREEALAYDLVTGKLNVSGSTLKSLETAGVIRVVEENYYRNPVKHLEQNENRKCLSKGQQYIVDQIMEDYQQDIRKTYLIHGITGSGKTEVYMELIENVIAEGKQAIMLIPEIALTYQTVLRFYKRFGDRVSIMNSTLSQGEKFDQFERAKRGEIDVIIGPRSALFMPFPNIGLIILDEEQEGSYKSETMPKYHARETAVELAALHHASVVLGSATPSLEAYHRAITGEYRLFHLTERLTGGMLPAVYTVDLREELRSGNRSIFSLRLQELISDRLEKGEQVMLFLNRRGYAGFVSCRACGHVMKCPHCDVSLSEHRNGKLICHYCGHEEPAVRTCPTCGSKYILGFRAGTEQIEEQLAKIQPQARVLRMDADTTKRKDSYEKILSDFTEGKADILLGTQMIVKGHDFPNVTLVGILAADLSLAANDYRASERTFQLLTQAAGRAGRGTKPGEVVIQTYQPEHYSIIHAANQDYEAFYEEEILYRDMLLYPPVAHIMGVQITAREEEKGNKLALLLAEVVKKNFAESKPVVIGPTTASIGKINDIYRMVFYVKHLEYEVLIQIKNKIELYSNKLELKKEQIQFDFDPMNTF